MRFPTPTFLAISLSLVKQSALGAPTRELQFGMGANLLGGVPNLFGGVPAAPPMNPPYLPPQVAPYESPQAASSHFPAPPAAAAAPYASPQASSTSSAGAPYYIPPQPASSSSNTASSASSTLPLSQSTGLHTGPAASSPFINAPGATLSITAPIASTGSAPAAPAAAPAAPPAAPPAAFSPAQEPYLPVLPQGAPIYQWYSGEIQGSSTYYGPYQGGGACGLDQPDGSFWPSEVQDIDFTIAMDQSQFNMGSCGMCIEITGTGSGSGYNPVNGRYVAFVNNLCPECAWGHVDFALSGDGLWNINWRAIPCNVGAHPIRWAFMGSNYYFLKITTFASRFPTARLRLNLNGAWTDGQVDNGGYFVFSNGGPYQFPLQVEITSVFGEVLQDTIASLAGGPSNLQYTVGFNGYVEPVPFPGQQQIPGSSYRQLSAGPTDTDTSPVQSRVQGTDSAAMTSDAKVPVAAVSASTSSGAPTEHERLLGTDESVHAEPGQALFDLPMDNSRKNLRGGQVVGPK